MYKAMLVEDEATVREGIRHGIDWAAHGFVLTAACENGVQALEALKAEPVNLLITDINMPLMDGLSLAKEVQENWPDTIIVILTGFSDFAYAQTAIRYRVREYVLKPITARQLREMLGRLRSELDGRSPARAAPLQRARSLMREECLTRLLAGELTGKELREALRQNDIALGSGACYALVATLRGAAKGEENALRDFAAAVPKLAPAGSLECLALPGGKAVALCNGDGLTQREALGVLRLAAGENSGSLCVAFGSLVDSAEAVPQSYQKALSAFEHLYRLPDGSVLSPGDIPKSGSHESLSSLRRALQGAVQMQELEKAEGLLADAVATLGKSGRTQAEVLRQLHKLVHSISEPREGEPFVDTTVQEAALAALESSTSLAQAHVVLLQYLRKLVQTAHRQGDTGARQAAAAEEYIKNHYGDAALSLQDVTSHLSVSTSHFSALFKGHTGLTFVEYLTRLRTEQAEHLLRTTDMKNYEIAQRVGYEDPGYFGALFKKATGCSPSEYRRQHRG